MGTDNHATDEIITTMVYLCTSTRYYDETIKKQLIALNEIKLLVMIMAQSRSVILFVQL